MYKNLNTILIVCLLLASISFADTINIGKGKLDNVGYENSQAIYHLNKDGLTTDITTTKLSNKEYKISVGTSKLLELEMKNRINYDTNYFRDCSSGYVCDMVIRLKASQAIRFADGQIGGGYQDGQANVSKIFYLKNRTVGGYTGLDGVQYPSHIEEYEETDLDTLTVYKNKYVDIHIIFTREELKEVDIYPIIYGHEYKDWSIWATGGDEYTYLINGTNYTFNVFYANGTFEVTTNIPSASVMVVAGGGSGGFSSPGGGGAGGLLINWTVTNITVGNYTVIVGEGGAALTGAGTGNDGQNSSFNGMNSTGGGGGGTGAGNGTVGGSGGGGGQTGDGAGGIAGQGNGGGSSNGGGGGSNETGLFGFGDSGTGKGGDGKRIDINGTVECYAAGAGGYKFDGGAVHAQGGCDGIEGGTTTLDGNQNTGSGGGAEGGGGANGIVIIRYEITTAEANQTPTITPTTAFTNTTLNFNVSFSGLGEQNITQINWTIYNSSTEYRVNTTSGLFANDTVSLWNESGFGRGDVLIFQVSGQLTNGTWLNATNSSSVTIQNSNLTISFLNFTANGSAFTFGPVEANVSVVDIDVGDNITLSWNFFKNNVNQTGLASSKTVISGETTTIRANSTPYTEGDDWYIRVQATDGTNTTPFNNSENTTIQALYTNLVVNYTSPQYDMVGYNHYLNATAQGGANLTANIYNGVTNASVPFTKLGNDYEFSILKYPTLVTVDSQQNYTWYLTQTVGALSVAENVSQYNITTIPSGIYLCNATLTTNTINYTIIDEQTGNKINATLNSVYTLEREDGNTKVTNIVFTNDTIFACISPYNFSISAIVQEEALNATGYATRIYNQPIQTYSNISIQRTISLLNATEPFTQSVLISVKSKQELPLQNYRVRIEKYNLSSNSYFLTNSVVTDTNGETSITALIQTPKYNVTVYDTNENPVFNSPAVIFCQDGTLPCQYTIRIGEDSPWYYNQTGDTSDDTYGQQDFGNVTVTGGRFCSFSNSTFNLNCTWNYSKADAYAVQLTLTNGSPNNKSIIASNFVSKESDSLGRASVNVPNITGYYIYSFIVLYYSESNETGLNYTKVVEIGSITINIPANQHGVDGWFTTAILTMAVALALSFNRTAMIAGAGIVPLFASIIGLISIGPITFSVIMMVTLIAIIRAGE